MGYQINYDFKSKNYQKRDDNIKFIIIHCVGHSPKKAINVFDNKKVSSHYLLGRQNKPILQLVEDKYAAYHAGISFWQDYQALNSSSIGIELVSAGFDDIKEKYGTYSDHQIDLLINLCQNLIKKYQIKPQNILGHSDIAPTRKIDPGPNFPWQKLAQNNIGMWPDDEDIKYFLNKIPRRVSIGYFQQNLAKLGYNIKITDKNDTQTKACLKVFQMHFRPKNFQAIPDAQTLAILLSLIKKYIAN